MGMVEGRVQGHELHAAHDVNISQRGRRPRCQVLTGSPGRFSGGVLRVLRLLPRLRPSHKLGARYPHESQPRLLREWEKKSAAEHSGQSTGAGGLQLENRHRGQRSHVQNLRSPRWCGLPRRRIRTPGNPCATARAGARRSRAGAVAESAS